MYQGTLATKGPWQALVTFQQMVILADKHGCVDMTPDAISRITTIPLEIIETGLQELSKPDPESRSPLEEGRRIAPLSDHRSWGWKVVNYEHYRKIRSEEERREYHRQYMRKRRSVKENVKESTGGEQSQPIAVSSMQEAISKETSVAQALHPTALPLREGQELKIPESLISEWAQTYPKVDVPATIKEMRAWCLSNPSRKKTKRGALRFINQWLRTAQEEYAQT
jgi:hypothetical protein